MLELIERYETDEKCHAALKASHWLSGFCCPTCHDERHSRSTTMGEHTGCQWCWNKSKVISVTIYQATKLPLKRWFLAMRLLTGGQEQRFIKGITVIVHFRKAFILSPVLRYPDSSTLLY